MEMEKSDKDEESDGDGEEQLAEQCQKRVGIELPTEEVRYKIIKAYVWKQNVKLFMESPCLQYEILLKPCFLTLQSSWVQGQAKIRIIDDASGVIKPGRMALLLGPPGCGKTSLLKALSRNLKVLLSSCLNCYLGAFVVFACPIFLLGEDSYNGYNIEEFVPQKTSAYVSQYDEHVPEMTARETLDFSARCQGVGTRAGYFCQRTKRKPANRLHYKILGLDICTDSLVRDALRRGIYGEKLNSNFAGEMIQGPIKPLFMDEIKHGLDISTTFQILTCLRQLAHINDATILVSLPQPSPETFDLSDDIILMAEGKIVYHVPCESVLEFFEDCGFRCPERKSVADFLQKVISRKDQAQYWFHTELAHNFVSVDIFSQKFNESPLGEKLREDLSVSYDKSKSHKDALSFNVYSLSKWQLFRACMSREFLLMKRNSLVYVLKISQLFVIALITYMVFFHTQMHVDIVDSSYYIGALDFALYTLLVDGLPEVALTVSRLAVFYKQKELRFYPIWAYAIPAVVLKLPLSFIISLVWTCLTYYVFGYSPEFGRFCRQFIMFFAVHVASLSMFLFMGSLSSTPVTAIASACVVLLLLMLFTGIMISRCLSVNDFLAPRWQNVLSKNMIMGREILSIRGQNFEGFIFWLQKLPMQSFHAKSSLRYKKVKIQAMMECMRQKGQETLTLVPI
ncbi:hypothetical protein Patl1_23926 [Pistacia atlantica]|uniref:Uncharacterized protein n=1 Tax=Pistacia atlantica TaxID=434234 RepID=A0ACC1A0U1_9ROSI|nr:hypothetical protein Patl1_23926 [Pistacia atlantica]